MKPSYNPPEVKISIDVPEETSEETFISMSIETLNEITKTRYGCTFTESLIQHKKVDKHKTKADHRNQKIAMMKKCRDVVQNELLKTVPQTVLKENESIASYNRKCLANYFETPSALKKKKTSHSPNFDHVTWDKQKLLHKLSKLQASNTKIVWSAVAKEHEIPNRNGGQVVKEFAVKNGINTATLSRYNEMKRRTRLAKKKFSGGKISIPVPPTVQAVKNNWKEMIASGKLLLGIPCSPYTVTRYKTEKGNLVAKDTNIYGRKIQMRELRMKLLQKHEQYMHIFTDTMINDMEPEELRHKVMKFRSNLQEGTPIEDLREMLRTIQRTRTLVLWHDQVSGKWGGAD